MADIFLSYAKEDREAALKIAQLLESAGWTVWWDRRIPAGRSWRSVLEEALGQMRCMVVLWSRNSIDSDWVKEEAEEAREIGKLVPVLIEPVKPPVGFRAIQAADLTHWDGSNASPGAQQLITDLNSLVGKPINQPKTEQGSASSASGNVTGITEPGHAEATPQKNESEISAERLLKDRKPSNFNFKPNLHLNRKTTIVGGAVLALLLGLALLWPKRNYQTADNPAVSEAKVTSPAPAPYLVNVGIDANQKEIKVNEDLTITLQGEYSDGTRQPVKDGVEWTSSNPAIASIDSEGRIKGYQAGSTKISGRHAGLVSPSWTLAVRSDAKESPPPAKLVGLRISATKRDLLTKERIPLQLTATYSDGTEKALSRGVKWQSSDPGVVAFNSNGEIEARRSGKAEVRAQASGVTSSPLYIVVKEPPPTYDSPEAQAQKTSAPRTAPPTAEQLRVKIGPYLNRAKDNRVKGDYAAAFAELDKAQGIDPLNAEVRREIEQTKRACNAERSLGRKGLEC